MKRTRNDEDLGFQPQLKYKAPSAELSVNPFQLMMTAARQSSTRQQTECHMHQQEEESQQALHAICTHCGSKVPELSARQCNSCQDVFCSLCSVANYDERDDRVFCLDCNRSLESIGHCNNQGSSRMGLAASAANALWSPARAAVGLLAHACGTPNIGSQARSQQRSPLMFNTAAAGHTPFSGMSPLPQMQGAGGMAAHLGFTPSIGASPFRGAVTAFGF